MNIRSKLCDKLEKYENSGNDLCIFYFGEYVIDVTTMCEREREDMIKEVNISVH